MHRIFDEPTHEEMRGSLEYHRSAQRRIPYRDFEIPFAEPPEPAQMMGEVWVRET